MSLIQREPITAKGVLWSVLAMFVLVILCVRGITCIVNYGIDHEAIDHLRGGDKVVKLRPINEIRKFTACSNLTDDEIFQIRQLATERYEELGAHCDKECMNSVLANIDKPVSQGCLHMIHPEYFK